MYECHWVSEEQIRVKWEITESGFDYTAHSIYMKTVYDELVRTNIDVFIDIFWYERHTYYSEIQCYVI